MITVTERAKEELKRVWSANVDDPELGYRLTPAAIGQYHLVPDREKEGDHVVEHEGRKVLLIGDDMSRALDGRTIDRDESAREPRLVISRE